MTGEVYAVANMKGGVGKTATVIALSQTLAALNPTKKILVIDADAQASASFCLAGDKLHTALIESGKTVDAFLEDFFLKKEINKLKDYIRPHVASVSHQNKTLDISLIASSPVLRSIERGLIHALTKKKYDMDKIESVMFELIKEQLEPIRSEFQFTIIDCAPGISLLTEAALRAADKVIVPTIPDYLSILGLNGFLENVWNDIASSGRKTDRTNGAVPFVLMTRMKQINVHKTHAQKLQQLAKKPGIGFRLFETIIPEHAGVPIAIERTATDHPTYRNLWGCIITELEALAAEVTQR